MVEDGKNSFQCTLVSVAGSQVYFG